MASTKEKHLTLGVIFGLSAALLVFVGAVADGGSLTASIFDGVGLYGGLGAAGNEIAGTGVRTDTNIIFVIGRVINFVLLFVGVIVFAMIVIAGFILVFSFGSDTSIQRAKKILIWSVAGLAVIIFAYVIVQFAVQVLTA